MNVKEWMRTWQDRFDAFGVEVMVADVAQSYVLVDVAGRAVILAPSLKVKAAERTLQKVYAWWRNQCETAGSPLWSLASC